MKTKHENAVDLQVHRVAAHLTFDGYGLSPYWGLVSAFESDLEDTRLNHAGDEYIIDSSTNYRGKISDPNGNIDSGLYEYKLSVWDTDEFEMGADFTFRAGYPGATHCDTGEEIEGMPSNCPESIRVQVESTNLDPVDIIALLIKAGQAIGLNPDYFCSKHIHEWSRIYALETYARVKRKTIEQSLVGRGGTFEQLALFGSGEEDGRGEWKWDHEETTGYYEVVALEGETFSKLIDGHHMPKRLKAYQPQHPRTEDSDAKDNDPLYHHKFEAQYWSDADSDSLPWHDYIDHLNELREAVLNCLSWSGIDITPEGPFVEDAFWSIEATDATVEIVANPLDELQERRELTAREQLLDPDITGGEFEVLRAMTDCGQIHYESLANQTDISSRTVYRAVEQFDRVLEVRNGVVQWIDDVVRQEISSIVDRLASAKERAFKAVRQTAEKVSPLSRDDSEPSALERWATNHGIIPESTYDDLEFKISEPVSETKLRSILRAGLEAAERSPTKTSAFKQAAIHWRDLDGNHHRGWQIVVDGKLLGWDPV